MKVLLLLFLVGCATAFVVHNDNAVEDDQEFLRGLDRAEAEAKTELGKKLQTILDALMNKMKEEVDKGNHVKEELIEKFKEVKQKLEELKMNIGVKAGKLIKILKEKSDLFWDYLLENKESQKAHADFNFRDLFQKLKESLLAKIDKEKLKARIEELFGKGSEMCDALLKIIKEKGDKHKQTLMELVDRYLGKEKRKRSIQEYWEKVKEYFKNLHIDLKEKYMKFGEWAKNTFKDGLSKGKDKMENIRNIAREFLEHTKGVSKEVAMEAREFLRPYKEDLGALWNQVKEAVKDIVQKED